MKCQYQGCGLEADKHNGKYCSREHAPFGRLYDHHPSTGKLQTGNKGKKKKGIYADFTTKEPFKENALLKDLVSLDTAERLKLTELMDTEEVEEFLEDTIP